MLTGGYFSTEYNNSRQNVWELVVEYTDKKENEIFLIYKEIQMESVA